jgi:hypothetical protein
MAGDLPDYYFRIRENGAAVFKVDTENRQRRIEMEEIAIANVRNGNIKPHGDHKLTAKELAVITEWLENRARFLAERELQDTHRAVEHLNLTAQWAQSKASDDQLEAVTESLLLAMHDLRCILVRKKAERLMKTDAPES